MPTMIGNRDDVVRTKAGHCIRFKENEEKIVPANQAVIDACVSRGHTVKKEAKAKPKPEVKADLPKENPLEATRAARKARATPKAPAE